MEKLEEPLVSIVVPVYNVETFIRRCIDSVLAQTYIHWELILVDDGSPDQCGEICDEYARQDSRIQVVHQKNQGLSGARNTGMKQAKGKYLYFLDSDDYIAANAMEIMVNTAEEGSYDIVMAGHCKVEPNGNQPVQSGTWKETDDLQYIRERLLMDKLPNFAWGKLYKRELWNGLEFPLGMTFEDFYSVIHTFMRARSAYVDPAPLYFYSNENVNSIMSHFNMKSYIKKRYDWYLGWAEHENIAESVFPQYREYCAKQAVHKLVRALILDYGVGTLTDKQQQSGIEYLKTHQHIRVSRGIQLCRDAVLKKKKLWLYGLSRIQRFILIKQDAHRKQKRLAQMQRRDGK